MKLRYGLTRISFPKMGRAPCLRKWQFVIGRSSPCTAMERYPEEILTLYDKGVLYLSLLFPFSLDPFEESLPINLD